MAEFSFWRAGNTALIFRGGSNEADYPRTRQGRSRGLPMADQEIRRQRCRVRLRAGGQGDGRSKTPRRNSLRRQGRRARAPRQGMLVRSDPQEVQANGRCCPLAARQNRQRRRHRQHALSSSGGPGLQAVAEGFRRLGYKDDHELNAAEWIVYDALYAYAKEMVKRGKPSGQFAN